MVDFAKPAEAEAPAAAEQPSSGASEPSAAGSSQDVPMRDARASSSPPSTAVQSTNVLDIPCPCSSGQRVRSCACLLAVATKVVLSSVDPEVRRVLPCTTVNRQSFIHGCEQLFTGWETAMQVDTPPAAAPSRPDPARRVVFRGAEAFSAPAATAAASAASSPPAPAAAQGTASPGPAEPASEPVTYQAPKLFRAAADDVTNAYSRSTTGRVFRGIGVNNYNLALDNLAHGIDAEGMSEDVGCLR